MVVLILRYWWHCSTQLFSFNVIVIIHLKKNKFYVENIFDFIGLPKNWFKRDIRRLFTASEIVSERGIYLDNDSDSNQGGTAYIEFVSEVDLEKALFYHDEHYGKLKIK